LKTAATVYDFLSFLWVLARLPELAAADETAIRSASVATRRPRTVGPPARRAWCAVTAMR